MSVFSWFYNLVVQSGIFYRLLWLLGPIHFILLKKTHNGDKITDDGGCSMLTTRWNGKNRGGFGVRMYTKIPNLAIRDDDVMLCGYPKTGCHWVYEILHMLVTRKPEVSKYGKVFEGMIEAMPEIVLDSIPSPRVLNCHIFHDELPRGIKGHNCKIILTIRCPKDTVVSYYNHVKSLRHVYGYNGTFQNFFKMFVEGRLQYGCYFDFYKSWEKVMKKYPEENQTQIYFLSFEDLKEDPVTKIQEMSHFIGRPVSQDFAERVAEASSFSKLKNKRKGNGLFRKGVVGDWRNWLSDEQADEINGIWREKMEGFQMPPGSKKTYCCTVKS